MIPKHLQPLFWDIDLDSFEPVSFPRFTISRILEYGDREAVAWLTASFAEEEIRKVIRTDRSLSRKSANFWALVYGVPSDEVSALSPEA